MAHGKSDFQSTLSAIHACHWSETSADVQSLDVRIKQFTWQSPASECHWLQQSPYSPPSTLGFSMGQGDPGWPPCSQAACSGNWPLGQITTCFETSQWPFLLVSPISTPRSPSPIGATCACQCFKGRQSWTHRNCSKTVQLHDWCLSSVIFYSASAEKHLEGYTKISQNVASDHSYAPVLNNLFKLPHGLCIPGFPLMWYTVICTTLTAFFK